MHRAGTRRRGDTVMISKLQTKTTQYICQVCGAEGRVRWSKSHNDMIVECSNVRCGTFIQMFMNQRCNIVGMYPRGKD